MSDTETVEGGEAGEEKANTGAGSFSTPFSSPSSSSPSAPRDFSASYSSLPPTPCPWLPSFAGSVLQGSCGWTDASIMKGRHFYPAHVHTAVDRLRHYSAFFPCVECDSSNYAIPPPSRVASWVAATPPSFLFHFKVYGLFTSLNVRADAIPGPLRDHLPASLAAASVLQLAALPPSFTTLLWAYWNSAILPAHTGGKMGLVVFQFHLSFGPTAEHRQHIEWCRRHLWPAYRMAVEFRDRRWVDGAELQNTQRWLASLDITLVCEDDLAQETYRHKEVLGEDPRLPIILGHTSTHSLYVRLHRRVGDNRGDRVLAADEFAEWVERLKEERKCEGGSGRAFFFMWGTDCWDDPVTNARQLDRLLRGTELCLDWAGIQRERSRQQLGGGNLLALFHKQSITAAQSSSSADPATPQPPPSPPSSSAPERSIAENAVTDSAVNTDDDRENKASGGRDEAAAHDIVEVAAPSSAQKHARLEAPSGSGTPKRQRTIPPPSRALRVKPTAKDRQSKAGNISSFFLKQPP